MSQNTSVPAGPAVLGWVAEGAPIAVGAASFATVVLGPPRKLGSIFVWSRELALRSDANQIFQTLLRESVAASIDSAMLSATAGSASAHAGLLAGVVALGAYPGGDSVAAEFDLAALANACAANGGSGRTTFVMSADRLARLQIIAPILAGSIDAVASNACPASRVIGIDAAALVIAVDQEPEIVSVNCGTVHMSTVPLEIVSTAPATADPVRDIWSTAAVAARQFYSDLAMLDQIDWEMLQRRDFKHDPEDPSKKERYQAEALIYKHLPIEGLLGLVSCNDEVKARLDEALGKRKLTIKVVKKSGWYF
jgi:ssDNA thymidine ADP-ribosyltransferase, DarT